MADGLCTEDTVSGQSTVVVKDYVRNKCGVNELDLVASACENVNQFFLDRNRDRDRAIAIDRDRNTNTNSRIRSTSTTDTDSDCGKVCGVPQFQQLQLQGPKHEDTFLVDMPCPSPDDDCRKKRCADRYDSSESSDSGVATLSCTDCSTYSGGSTASSDITDPGSPFSTASSHSEDSSAASNNSNSNSSNSNIQQTKMPPNIQQNAPWPWSSTTAATITNCSGNTNDSPPLKRSNSVEDKTAIIINNNNINNNHTHSPSNNKRIRTEANNVTSTNSNSNTTATIDSIVKTKALPMCTVNTVNNSQNSEIASPIQTVQTVAVTKRPNQSKRSLESSVSFVVGGKIQQGKITEYFKAQMKPNTASIKRELITAKNIDSSQNVHKYFTLVDGPKVILDNKSTKFNPYWKKLNVRALAVANPTPVKKVILDTKTKKITQLISNVPRKILPAPAKREGQQQLQQLQAQPQQLQLQLQSQPMVKLTALRYQQLQECNYVSPRPAKPPDGNNKKVPVTNLNLTVSSTVVPIVKLNNLPSKLNGSIVNNTNPNPNHLSVSVETAVPTVPTPKPKSPNTNNNNHNHNHHHHNHNNNKSPPPMIKKSPSVDSTSTDISSTNSESTSSSTISSGISVADSDSGFGSLLTVSVASTPTSEISEPQKSPILSQPKTIRFPAKQSEDQRRQDNTDSGLCRWQECQAQFDTSGALLEHLQIKHVISQATQEHYVCLWVGCKVHGRTSCSRSWLERHVLGHAGNKPFRCIVDGCGGRFSSQQTLEKHVNSHFNSSESNSNGSTRKSLESGTTKLFKRNGKKLRYRRQPWSARMFDFFDAGIMEGLQHQLISMTEKRTAGDVCNKAPGDSVTLHSRILARRTEPNGERKVLLKWHPPDIIADEWVLESKSTQTKTVSIPALEPSALDSLGRTLFPAPQIQNTETRKNRRKRNAKCS